MIAGILAENIAGIQTFIINDQRNQGTGRGKYVRNNFTWRILILFSMSNLACPNTTFGHNLI